MAPHMEGGEEVKAKFLQKWQFHFWFPLILLEGKFCEQSLLIFYPTGQKTHLDGEVFPVVDSKVS